tara:strand:- start:1035 stop:1235 length:201 start_codon:yes stop_codon:yes gene_type:complete
VIKIFLIAMVFNFETEKWAYFDKLPVIEMPTMEQCLTHQNAFNRRFVSAGSNIRSFCVEKEPDIYT